MIKTVIKRWLSRAFMTILIIAAIVTIIKSSWLHSLVDIGICLVCLGMAVLCAALLWPDKDEEPVTQPIQPAPTMIPMPTVHLESVVDLPMIAPLMPTPYADVMDAWLRGQWRPQIELMRRDDEDDGDGVEA